MVGAMSSTGIEGSTVRCGTLGRVVGNYEPWLAVHWCKRGAANGAPVEQLLVRGEAVGRVAEAASDEARHRRCEPPAHRQRQSAPQVLDRPDGTSALRS